MLKADWPKILRRTGTGIALALFLVECFDAWVTPRPDWIWFAAAGLLAALCAFPRRRQERLGESGRS